MSDTFVEIDHKIISTAVLILSADLRWVVLFCCALLYVHSSFAIILMGKRELVAFLCFLLFWCLVIVVWLFLTMPRVCLQFVIVVFLDHTHLLFLLSVTSEIMCTEYWLTA